MSRELALLSDDSGRDLVCCGADGRAESADEFAHRRGGPGNCHVDGRDDLAGARAHRRGDRPQRAFEFLVVDGDARAAHLVKFGKQRSFVRQGPGAALDEVDALQDLLEVGARQEGEQGLAGGAAVGGYPGAHVEGELEVVVAAGPPSYPVDQDHVGVVADRKVGRVPG